MGIISDYLESVEPEATDQVEQFFRTIEELGATPLAETIAHGFDKDWQLVHLLRATSLGLANATLRHIEKGAGGWGLSAKLHAWSTVEGFQLVREADPMHGEAWMIAIREPKVDVYSRSDEEKFVFATACLTHLRVMPK